MQPLVDRTIIALDCPGENDDLSIRELGLTLVNFVDLRTWLGGGVFEKSERNPSLLTCASCRTALKECNRCHRRGCLNPACSLCIVSMPMVCKTCGPSSFRFLTPADAVKRAGGSGPVERQTNRLAAYVLIATVILGGALALKLILNG